MDEGVALCERGAIFKRDFRSARRTVIKVPRQLDVILGALSHGHRSNMHGIYMQSFLPSFLPVAYGKEYNREGGEGDHMANFDREEEVALRQKQSERANRKDYYLAHFLGLYVQGIARFSVLELTV